MLPLVNVAPIIDRENGEQVAINVEQDPPASRADSKAACEVSPKRLDTAHIRPAIPALRHFVHSASITPGSLAKSRCAAGVRSTVAIQPA